MIIRMMTQRHTCERVYEFGGRQRSAAVTGACGGATRDGAPYTLCITSLTTGREEDSGSACQDHERDIATILLPLTKTSDEQEFSMPTRWRD